MAGLITDWTTLADDQLVNDSNLPDWLKAKKQQAVAQLKTLSVPSRKLEYWRYSDANRLALKGGEASPSSLESHPVSIANDGVEQVVIKLNDNGFTVSDNCPGSVRISPINAIDESRWLDLDMNQETVANLANTACFMHGVSVECSAALEVNLVFEYDYKFDEQWRYVRNQINVDTGAQFSVEERFNSGQVNVVNVYDLQRGSVVNRHQMANLSDAQNLISFNQFELSAQAQLNSTNQHLGGSLQHHLHRVNFNGNQAVFKMGTVNKSINNNNIADLVEVNHNKKSNQSDVTHRSIADGASQIFTNAKAFVAVGADESEIEQDLKNILLSPDAKIFSKPELEVYADEVVAAHGSTIGALDDQSLFYLQSRGIDIKQARAIMIESFEQEALL
ncbi:SufD family Fe-S cluster assembly protein [Marinicella sp. S1101]|uniref:SufD family Fe-S cluster assembly protein n=1 Tax=Marinicella marina TaxID=2996016 RepID=UPI002260A4C3|nr:SufD family Fe-S cluster assembly protein [Marinicella marina]MCX7554664.1 SufD family Fe-S cluster assembly protein [Marinicella marina]MDJ1140729.1 SufD family Fe-S cluster assembly protein [Marinicella marina]